MKLVCAMQNQRKKPKASVNLVADYDGSPHPSESADDEMEGELGTDTFIAEILVLFRAYRRARRDICLHGQDACPARACRRGSSRCRRPVAAWRWRRIAAVGHRGSAPTTRQVTCLVRYLRPQRTHGV